MPKFFTLHLIVVLLVGYMIGYYWRGLGNMTIGKLVTSKAS